jgi:hypothetical protein
MQDNDNIIPFPSKKREVEIYEDGYYLDTDVPKTVSLAKFSDAEIMQMVDGLAEELLRSMYSMGFNFHDMNKEIGLVMESIRSLLYKTQGKHHTLHDFADHVFVETEPGILQFRNVAQNLKEPT